MERVDPPVNEPSFQAELSAFAGSLRASGVTFSQRAIALCAADAAGYRKVTGGFRSEWGADLFASIRTVVGTAARTGVDAYAVILNTLCECQHPAPGRMMGICPLPFSSLVRPLALGPVRQRLGNG